MNVLTKDVKVTVIAGTSGQTGTAAVPAKPGYYTTVQVRRTGPVPAVTT